MDSDCTQVTITTQNFKLIMAINFSQHFLRRLIIEEVQIIKEGRRKQDTSQIHLKSHCFSNTLHSFLPIR